MPRPSSSERARRMLALLPLLREQGEYPLASLAAAVGTDAATVAGDIETLSLCGVDDWTLVAVYVEDGEAVVFGDLPALERPARLTAVEARALLAALDAVGAADGGPLRGRLEALAAAGIDAEEMARTVRASIAPGGDAHAQVALAALAAAGRTARITYTPFGGTEATERVVQPWRLYSARGAWYLHCWSESAGAQRTYRVDRIGSVAPAGGTFEPPADLPPVSDAAPDPVGLPRATIRFASDAPDLTERDWPHASFHRNADGSVTAEVPYAGTAWIARKVVARLGAAVVIEPAEIREAVRRLALDEIAGTAEPVG